MPSLPTFSQNLLKPKTFALVGISFSFLLNAPGPHLVSPFALFPFPLANRLAMRLTSGLAAPSPSRSPTPISSPFRLHSSIQCRKTSFTFSLSTLLFVSIKLGANHVVSDGRTPFSTKTAAEGRRDNERFSLILMRFRPSDREASVVRVR